MRDQRGNPQKGRARNRGVALVGVFLCLGVSLQAWAESNVVATLSRNLVAIQTDFTGSNLMIFGATRQPGDVIITVRGPSTRKIVYQKKRVFGIWVNYAKKQYGDVPAYYRLFTSRPLGEWLPDTIRKRYQLGAHHLNFRQDSTGENPYTAILSGRDIPQDHVFTEALAEINEKDGIYALIEQGIDVMGNNLFRTNLDIPAGVAPGTYLIEVLLIEEGEVVGAQVMPLFVRQTGFTVTMSKFAHRIPWLYGFLSVLVAIGAGLGANWIFHRYNL